MYNACITPIITYNLSAAAYTDAQLECLNSAQRKHVRIMMGIFYPKKISNHEIYERTKITPLSITVHNMRLKLFGHILRGDNGAPAYKVMEQYFQTTENKSAKRHVHLPHILHSDLALAHNRFKDSTDLKRLREQASNRELWKELVKTIMDEKMTMWRRSENHRAEKRKIYRENNLLRGPEQTRKKSKTRRETNQEQSYQTTEEERNLIQFFQRAQIEDQFAIVEQWERQDMEIDIEM